MLKKTIIFFSAIIFLAIIICAFYFLKKCSNQKYINKFTEIENSWESLSDSEKISSIIYLLKYFPSDKGMYRIKSHSFYEIADHLENLHKQHNITFLDSAANHYKNHKIEINSILKKEMKLVMKILLHEGTHFTDDINSNFKYDYDHNKFYAAITEINAHYNETIYLSFLIDNNLTANNDHFNSTFELKNGFGDIKGYDENGIRGLINVFRYRIYSKPGNYWQIYADKCSFKNTEKYYSSMKYSFIIRKTLLIIKDIKKLSILFNSKY